MPSIKLNITGSKRTGVSANWETHVVDSTLHDIFSGVVDGFNINKWVLNSDSNAIKFRKSGVDLGIGDFFSLLDMQNGIVIVEIYPGISPSTSTSFSLYGEARYDIVFNVNSF